MTYYVEYDENGEVQGTVWSYGIPAPEPKGKRSHIIFGLVQDTTNKKVNILTKELEVKPEVVNGLTDDLPTP